MRSLVSAALALNLVASLMPAALQSRTLPPRAGGSGSESSGATLSPYFWVKSEDADVESLPLKSTEVKAEVSGVIADVKVCQVYKNQGRKPLEAIYVFPGSTRAAVYAMKMTIGSRVIEAKIREKEQARRDYEEARQQGRSASLLEQQRPNVFQMNVANLMPGDEIRVELSYTELLVPTEGEYRFVYPTVVGPRYSNTSIAKAKPSEAWVANPYTREGEAPLSTLDLQVRVVAGLPIEGAVCETHRTGITYQAPDALTVRLDPREAQGGNRDFILKYRLSGNAIQSGLLLSKGGRGGRACTDDPVGLKGDIASEASRRSPDMDENFFLLQVQPPKALKPAQMPGREYIFIVDVSGSMHGYPLDTAKVLIRDLVTKLRPGDRFNVEVFESGSAVWSPGGSKSGTQENLAQALAFMDQQHGGGGTEIIPALKRALTLPRAEGFSRTFVIATDGYISVEPQVLDVIRENLGQANLFAFGIGTSVNRFLIEGMAHAGMGEPFVITRPEDAAPEAKRFHAYISAPVLTNIQVSFHGFEAYDVEPRQIPDVFADRPVLCFGKWKGNATGTVEVTGQSGEGAFHQVFQVQEGRLTEGSAALRNLWARHRIQQLGDYAGLGQPHAKEVTELGLKYGLLTEYTSFIAIDSAVRNAKGSTVTVKQPLPMPEGVSNLAVAGAASMPSPRPLRAAKVKREALQTQREMAPMAATEVKAAKDEDKKQAVVSPELRRLLQAKELVAQLGQMPKGTVLLLEVDTSGRVLKAEFSASFQGDQAALALIRSWTVPGWKDGKCSLRISLPL